MSEGVIVPPEDVQEAPRSEIALLKMKDIVKKFPRFPLNEFVNSFLVPALEEMREEYLAGFEYVEEHLDDEDDDGLDELLDESKEVITQLGTLIGLTFKAAGFLNEDGSYSEKCSETLQQAHKKALESTTQYLTKLAEAEVDEEEDEEGEEEDEDDNAA